MNLDDRRIFGLLRDYNAKMNFREPDRNGNY